MTFRIKRWRSTLLRSQDEPVYGLAPTTYTAYPVHWTLSNDPASEYTLLNCHRHGTTLAFDYARIDAAIVQSRAQHRCRPVAERARGLQ